MRFGMILPKRIHDLSQPVFSNCPQYPDSNPRPAQIRHFYNAAVQGVNKEIVELSTHTGTHCDAALHFFEDGLAIDSVPLERYCGRAVIFDLRGGEPASAIQAGEIEARAQGVQPDDIVLLNTGWGRKRAHTKEFLTQYRYLSGDAARLLVDKHVKGVGVDALSIGGYGEPTKARPPHEVLLGAGKFIAEDLYFPDEVMDEQRERLFVAFPIKLQGCGGAWARATLWEF